ncbi:MAG TPA: DUF2062 domain-containing protein [Tepidisphaeraceae bacterium]|nr:DUF2062 domain-containing protein [Tepidisphaeraceae bacterium]
MIQPTPPNPPLSPVVVAPTYNNARTLGRVVARVRALGLPIIVVDDGSTDATADVLEALARQAAPDGGAPPLIVLTHARNSGKAAALRTAFEGAAARGYSHAVSIDTDGQLDPADIPAMLASASLDPAAMVIGTRDETAADYPARSRVGRHGSNFFVWLESGLRVSDSQCGLRVYPLTFVRAAGAAAGHFGFETEILTRAGWARVAVREVPVSCRYLPPGERVSHFRPWLDSARAVGMHARLVGRALLPWPHRKFGRHDGVGRPALWRRAVEWLSPARAWRELRTQAIGPREMATGVALGVFIGNLPIYGVQTLLSLYAARRLHLNPLSVVVGSHVSTPPVGPLLIATAIGVGHFLLHGQWLRLPAWQQTWRDWLRLSGSLLLEWSVGAVLVGGTLALIAFFVSTALLRRVAVEKI